MIRMIRGATCALALTACARAGYEPVLIGDGLTADRRAAEIRLSDSAPADRTPDNDADAEACACRVGTTCYAAGQVSSLVPCERCEPETSKTTLTLFAGHGCVTTLAGTGSAGRVDGPLAQARFARPHGITTDGSTLYVADQDNEAIRRIAGGQVSTLFGGGGQGFVDGSFLEAKLQAPLGVAVAAGVLFVADAGNNRIRAAQLTSQTVSTAAGSVDGYLDGAAANARFKLPHDVATVGQAIYIADEGAHAIRRLADGGVTTIAGNGTSGFADGPGDAARFAHPTGIDATSLRVLVADSGNCRIRRVRLDHPEHLTSTVAGGASCGNLDGPVSAARFSDPHDVVEVSGAIYVAGGTSNRVRVIANGQVTTLIGDGTAGSRDGAASASTLSNPTGIAAGANGVLYIAEMDAHRIRVYTP